MCNSEKKTVDQPASTVNVATPDIGIAQPPLFDNYRFFVADNRNMCYHDAENGLLLICKFLILFFKIQVLFYQGVP